MNMQTPPPRANGKGAGRRKPPRMPKGRQVEVAELPSRHAFANARRAGREVVVVLAGFASRASATVFKSTLPAASTLGQFVSDTFPMHR